MNPTHAHLITVRIQNLIQRTINHDLHRSDESRIALKEQRALLEDAIGAALTEPKSCTCRAIDIPAANTALLTFQTLDGVQVEVGSVVTLYQHRPNKKTLCHTGFVSSDGHITDPQEGCYLSFDLVTTMYVTDPAADTTREIRPTSSTHWQTKDCAMLHTDKIYALWYCDSITQEILRVNGRVTFEGKLAELAGMDSASIDIGQLYFWRVNLLKDQLAAQSTSTAVEVEYSDNAEMNEWEPSQSPEYD
jgi:hypothetical protein